METKANSKKIILAAAITLMALGLSGCANNSEEKIDNEIIVNNIINNSAEVKENSAPVDSNTSSSAVSADEVVSDPAVNNKIMKTLEGQTDLFAQYSQALIKTSYGDITVKFYGEESPVTVNNFLNLAKDDFYNGTKFHRVIKDFMIQGGDPKSKEADTSYWGTGGPAYRFNDEFNTHKLVAGSLAMANSGANTNGSQFFIVTAATTPWLDGKHTNFGEVVKGMDVVKKIEAAATGAMDRPVKDIVINSIELLK